MQQTINTTSLLLSLLLSASAVLGQTTFYKFYGSPSNSETATAVAEVPDGGFVFTGQSGSHQPDNDDIFLTRTDANGAELWTVYFGGAENEVATAVAVASDGGFFISGYAEHIDGGDSDGRIIKTDANGALIWSKDFVMPNPEQVTALAATPDGGCIFTTNGSWSTPGDPQASVVKFDQNGVYQWGRDYAAPGQTDELWAVAVNPDGNTYITAGNFNGSSLLTKFTNLATVWTAYPTDTIVQYGLFVRDLAISPVTNNIAVVGYALGIPYLNLFNPNGVKLWARRIPGPTYYNYEMNVAFTPSGEIITTANQGTVIFSASGNVLAQTTFGAAQNYMGTIKDVIGTSSGNCLHAGLSTANGGGEDAALLLSTNMLQEQWHQTYGQEGPDHNEAGWMVRQTPDGGYILCGTKAYEATGADYYVIKTDGSGTVQWENHYGGPDLDYGRSIEPNPSNGGYVISGYSYQGTERFWNARSIDASGVPIWSKEYFLDNGSNFGSGLLPLPNSGFIGYSNGVAGPAGTPGRVLLFRLDAIGDTIWTRKAGNGPYDEFLQLIRTSDGGYAAAGADDNPPIGYVAAWIVKFDANGTKLWEKTLSPTGSSGIALGYGITELANGELAFAALMDNDLTANDSLYIARYSSNGTLLFEKFFEDGGRYDVPRIHKDVNNDLIINTNYRTGSVDSLLILKTDLSGNVLARQTHRVAQYQYFWESQNTSDGGAVSIGYANKGNSDDFVLVKTNASGELTGTFPLLKNRPKFTASPLPSAGPVDLTLECKQIGQVVFRLFDPSGKLAFEKTASKTADLLWEHFDLSLLPSGTYFWQATIGAQSVGMQWIKY